MSVSQGGEARIKQSKQWRVNLDTVLQEMKAATQPEPPGVKVDVDAIGRSRERSLAITKLQEAIMWLGMDLKERAGGQSCYAHGYDVKSPQVDPPADGLKL